LPGGKARQFLRTSTGEQRELDLCSHVVVGPTERLISISCGGGGYGPPRAREPERVLNDVREGWISRERARSVYGVSIDRNDELELEETRILRSSEAPLEEEEEPG
jgi:N-methylhydantoinase B